jgi:hypothetical protein
MNDINLRRAIVGTVLRADRPMTVAEVIDAVVSSRPATNNGAPLSPRFTADVLRYQARLGRLRRVRRGEYVAIRDAWSRTTAWRYANWEIGWDLAHPEVGDGSRNR